MANQIAAAIRRSPRSQRFYASALGLSPQAMNDRMRGRTRWSLADAIILSRLLGKTVDELVGDEDLPIVGTLAEHIASLRGHGRWRRGDGVADDGETTAS